MALAIALPALFVVSAGIAIMQDYRATIAQAESDMRSVAVALEEHAMRTFGEADTLVRIAIAEIGKRGLAPTAADERGLHDILAAATRDSPLTNGAAVLSPDGRIRASAAVYPVTPLDIRDREYYTALRAHRERGILIARPVASRPTGKWGIPVARRVDNPDGSMNMIVIVGVDMAYFDRFYRNLELGYSIRLMLLRRDGWVIMQTPRRADVEDRNLADTRPFRMLASAPIGTYQTEHSVVDGIARVVGYASVAQAPLVAVASVARAEVMQPWVKRSRQVAGLGVLSSVLVLCLLRFLWLQLAVLETAQEGLARRNEDLDAARRRFQELVDGIDGVVWEAVLPDFRFTYVSGNAEAISGYDAEQWIGDRQFWRDRLCTGPDGKHVEPVLSTARPGLIKPIEHHIVTPDGKDRWLRSNVMLADSGAGELHVRGVTIDITPQKVSELQLFEANHVDPLTRLPNRRALVERMGHALLLARHNQSVVAMVLIDIDNFSTLNDSLGHETGDEALVQVAARLHGCLEATDMLGRMGGDEFAVVMEDVDRVALKVEHLAERISASLENKIPVDGRELYLTASMGIALFPQDGADAPALIRNADTALYRVKAAGRNGWQFFDSSMARQVEHRLDLETALRHAIEREEFRVYYQPQRSLEDGKIIGAEALVRWERPNVGMVPTQEFIRLAEENGFIVGLGNWVLRAACHQAVAWGKSGLHVRIAVNVSVVQLQQSDFVAQVRAALTLSGLPSHCLELEITEGAFVADLLDALDKLHQIKGLGVELAVDDFGTGYSSLSYLKQMPVDRLKIDQSFVRDIPRSADDCAIVRAILAMASNLNLQVIAEGVESEDQLAFLRDEGCQEIQGFLLSPPVNPDNFIACFRNAGRVPEPSRVGPDLP
ncbi:bifunctional diguanylate cyclase/phosphodiesterase [Massilia putida]|uniref:bifunctional diguanylate cyclase/phosphodiesterase n=1 Tax=Massilia putida TaxID=1141883 RepID=UPI0009534B7C|nr:EAL domain-containing protein [Massilia putida]